MDEPSKSKGTGERGQKVCRKSEDGPHGADPYQKVQEVFQGDLGKEDNKDDKGDEKRNQKSFQ
jgi:hypothetical protein